MEKLGYQVVVNPYMIKVEKMPAVPENWMGILEFKEPIEYVFFCLVLMFLEDKEAEEQFVLSELTEYVQSQYQEEQIDWTVYRYRRHMIKVMKYCVAVGILNVDDGSEEGFAKDDTSEVLYLSLIHICKRQIAYQNMEYFCFIHFTVNTFTGSEWGLGDEPESIFNPEELDARQWAKTAAEGGMKGLILTCKHHCLLYTSRCV